MPTLCLAAAVLLSSGAAPNGVALDTGSGWDVSWGDHLVFSYRFSDRLMKPYIHPLLTPRGHSVTLDSPADHIHHHGLMFGWGNVQPANEGPDYHLVFFGEEGDPHTIGRVLPDPDHPPKVVAGDDAVRIITHNQWRRLSDGLLVLTEQREIISHRPRPGHGNLLTWITEQRAEVDLSLGPTPGRDVSYYGLGLRTPRDMRWALFVNSHGKRGTPACYGDRADWCACSTTVEPARGFAMFDHPDNPRHPTGYFVMDNDFSYMTASFVSHEPYLMRKGDVLRLCYGVLAFDGDINEDAIADEYDRWTKLPWGPAAEDR